MLVVHLVIFGGIPASAQTEIKIEDKQVDIQEENQQMDVIVDQKQQIDIGEESDNIIQNQEVTGEQEQTASNQKNEPNSTNIEQSVEVHAEQSQSGASAEKIDAEQEQTILVEYSQSPNKEQGNEQNQESSIKTNQHQSIYSNHETDAVKQSMKTEIKSHQKVETNLDESQSKNRHGVNIKSNLEQNSETSGDAEVHQKQRIEAVTDNGELEEEKVRIKAIAENGINIVKKVSHFVVTIFQSIIVNDEEIDTHEEEYILESQLPVQKSQEYRKEFDWGILSILNNVTVHPSVEQGLQTTLKSNIELDHFIEDSRQSNDVEEPIAEEPPAPDIESPTMDNPETKDPNHPSEIKPEKEVSQNPILGESRSPNNGVDYKGNRVPIQKKVLKEPRKIGKPVNANRKQQNAQTSLIQFFIDRDNDGVPNHLEINKFKTDPFKEDTDDDGLSDEFEIKYHSPTSFYFTFECMEYDWIDFIPPSDQETVVVEDVEDWKKMRLSPLHHDGDHNKIIDELEDYDGDGISNREEQSLGTNPYIHNETGGYVGPTGLELAEIIEQAQKGC